MRRRHKILLSRSHLPYKEAIVNMEVHDMDNKKTGILLKTLRMDKGLTQQQVADQLFLSPKTISKWENGDGLPDIQIISSVARLFDVTVDDILNGRILNRDDLKQTESNQDVLHTEKLDRLIYLSIGIQTTMVLFALVIHMLGHIDISILVTILAAFTAISIVTFGYLNHKERYKSYKKQKDNATVDNMNLVVKKHVHGFIIYEVLMIYASIFIPLTLLDNYISDSMVGSGTLFILFVIEILLVVWILRKTRQWIDLDFNIKKSTKISDLTTILFLSVLFLVLTGLQTDLVTTTNTTTSNELATLGITTLFVDFQFYFFRGLVLLFITVFLVMSLQVKRTKKHTGRLIFIGMLCISISPLLFLDFYHTRSTFYIDVMKISIRFITLTSIYAITAITLFQTSKTKLSE